MKHKHNKKRNTGIVYELLLRHIASRLIESDKVGADKALEIISEHFGNHTEVYKEFRLFNAMAKSTLSDTSVAAGVLSECKDAIKRLDYIKLSSEKSLLIKDINYKLNDSLFYERKIPDYKVYANIQNMFNEWKKGDSSNLKKIINYEKEVVEYLLKEKKEKEYVADEKADRLVVKIMTEKINDRYAHLNSEQKKLLSDYTFRLSEGEDNLKEYLSDYKHKVTESLRTFKKKEKNKILLEKVDKVIDKVSQINTDDIGDIVIEKFMIIAKLNEEIQGAK